jgi:hypothetical protein
MQLSTDLWISYVVHTISKALFDPVNLQVGIIPFHNWHHLLIHCIQNLQRELPSACLFEINNSMSNHTLLAVFNACEFLMAVRHFYWLKELKRELTFEQLIAYLQSILLEQAPYQEIGSQTRQEIQRQGEIPVLPSSRIVLLILCKLKSDAFHHALARQGIKVDPTPLSFSL